MVIPVLLFLVGLLCLIKGGDWVCGRCDGDCAEISSAGAFDRSNRRFDRHNASGGYGIDDFCADRAWRDRLWKCDRFGDLQYGADCGADGSNPPGGDR